MEDAPLTLSNLLSVFQMDSNMTDTKNGYGNQHPDIFSEDPKQKKAMTGTIAPATGISSRLP